MFRNIALNLKDGRHFVSITVVPTQDPTDFVNTELHARPPPEGSGGLFYSVIRDVEDGIYFHAHGHTDIGDVDFDCYHLKRNIYEAAAREAGLRGELKWGLTNVPENYLRGEGPGGASMEEIQSYREVPNYEILVIAK